MTKVIAEKCRKTYTSAGAVAIRLEEAGRDRRRAVNGPQLSVLLVEQPALGAQELAVAAGVVPVL